MKLFLAFFALFFILNCQHFNRQTKNRQNRGPDSAQKNHNPSKNCQAKAIPSTKAIQKALDSYPDPRLRSSDLLNKIEETNRDFVQNFLAHYPKNCDISKIQKALENLDSENPAMSQLEANKIYFKRWAQVFDAILKTIAKKEKKETLSLIRDQMTGQISF